MQDELDRLGAEGGAMLDAGDAAGALVRFERGLALSREAAVMPTVAWFAAHVGFALVALERHAEAVYPLTEALIRGQIGNPYVHMQRGIALYGSGDLKEAKEELFKAAALAGQDVFTGVDATYWDFAIKGMRLPAGVSRWEDWDGCEPGSPMHSALCNPGMYRMFVPKAD